MLRITLAGVKARFSRLVLSSIAIVLGVAFVTGTLVLSGALQANLKDSFARQARNVDVMVEVASSRGPVTERPAFDQNVVDAVRQVPGVGSVDVRRSVAVPLVGSGGKADEASLQTLAEDPRLRPFDVEQGRFPERPGEIAINKSGAAAGKLSVGQQISLLDQEQRPVSFTITGIFDRASGGLQGEAQVVVLPEAAAPFVDTSKPDYGASLVATALPGVDQRVLADRVKTALNQPSFTVRTGEEYTTARLARYGGGNAVAQVMLVFAIIALVVASMVIYNTFTILIAQRTRELALLRCVGAERKQVFRSVLIEAVVMGLVASVLGLVLGIGLAALMQVAMVDTAVRVPVGVSTVVWAFVVGVLVTVVSAWLPARKATKVSPIEALRTQQDSHEEVARTGKRRIVAVAVLTSIGVLLVLGGEAMNAIEPATLLVAAGSMVLLSAAIAAGPLLVGPVNRVLGVVPRKIFGVPAELAAGNAGRNPKRTAATTAALMIGVAVVTMATVVVSSVKETQNIQIDKEFPADLTVTSSLYDRELPASAAQLVAARPEVASIGIESSGNAILTSGTGTDEVGMSGLSAGALGSLVRPEPVSGDLGQLTGDKIALSSSSLSGLGLKLGDRLGVRTVDYVTGTNNPEKQLTVSAVFTGRGVSAYVDLDTYRALVPQAKGIDNVLVKLKDGVSAADGRAAVEQAVASVPIAKIGSAVEQKNELNEQIDSVLALVWALIGLAVVIALFGIANTLTLSVLERTRETALLRALGFTKGQLRLMLVIESVLMALMGALTGVVLGSVFAGLLVTAMSKDTLPLTVSVPFGRLVLLLVAAAVAAVAAAAFPAKRAARASIVAGMAEV